MEDSKCGHQFQFSVCRRGVYGRPKTKKIKLFFLLHYFSLRVINYISHKICINWIRRERGWRVESYTFFCAFDHHQTMLWLKLSSHQFFGVFFPLPIGASTVNGPKYSKCGAHDGLTMESHNHPRGTTVEMAMPCVWRIFQWLFCFAFIWLLSNFNFSSTSH